VNDNVLKLLTRDLIAACGGLPCAARATGLSEGQLSRCQNPNAPDFLNLKATLRLQQFCGKAIITAPMTDASAEEPGSDVFEEVLDVVEAAGAALVTARKAKADGRKTPNETREIDRALILVEQEVREARAANAA
jgi:hypothetical protein